MDVRRVLLSIAIIKGDGVAWAWVGLSTLMAIFFEGNFVADEYQGGAIENTVPAQLPTYLLQNNDLPMQHPQIRILPLLLLLPRLRHLLQIRLGHPSRLNARLTYPPPSNPLHHCLGCPCDPLHPLTAELALVSAQPSP